MPIMKSKIELSEEQLVSQMAAAIAPSFIEKLSVELTEARRKIIVRDSVAIARMIREEVRQ